MEEQISLTKKERKELKRQEKLEAREVVIQKRHTKRIINWTIGLALVIIPIGGLIWYSVTRPPIPESDIVSRNGLHWHPELAIYVKDIKQEIPANIGMGGVEMPVHTHDSTGVIHLEMSGLIRKENITLNQFFKVWGKDINSFGTNLKMTVNGKENTDYGNYLMQDKDKIELRYE
jgi:hypothetical protein